MFGVTGYIMAGMGVVILVMAGLGYWYFSWSQNKLEIMAANQARLEQAVETQKQTIEKMEIQDAIQRAEMKLLGKKFNQIEERNADLERLFAEHELGHLAEQKPGLIENRVNKGTREILKQFEDITNPETYYEEDNTNTDSE